jgi:hypothetical protein
VEFTGDAAAFIFLGGQDHARQSASLPLRAESPGTIDQQDADQDRLQQEGGGADEQVASNDGPVDGLAEAYLGIPGNAILRNLQTLQLPRVEGNEVRIEAGDGDLLGPHAREHARPPTTPVPSVLSKSEKTGSCVNWQIRRV